MPNYVIDTLSTKEEIKLLHESDCPYAPLKAYSIKLGFFTECTSALRYIRLKDSMSNFYGCKYCCRSCSNKKR